MAHAMKLTTLALLLLLVGCKETPTAPPDKIQVTLGGQTISLELALTEAQIEHGLMERATLDANAGMIFVFKDAAVRDFWMKNCLIPIDVIFTDSTGRVVSIRTMTVPDKGDALPPSYSSYWPAQFAVELNGGRAAELGIHEGDRLDLPVDELKRLSP
ncbi:MAG: DUF192 domain-containing protein [Planctomycetes bacterium]|nr:DUF192 domain-containing protein [Planctomycetota bacterium]